MAKEIGNWSKQRPSARQTRTSASAFTRHLQPGERLIWSSRGRGHSGNRPAPGIASMADMGALLFAAVMLALIPSLWTGEKRTTVIAMFAFCLALAAYVAARSLFGHALMVYGLTDKRLLIANYLAFGAVKSFQPEVIDRLIVDDYNRRGDVIFRKADRDRFSLRAPWDPGDALVGVDDPEGVARLIQSTLRRNTPIEHVGKTRR